MVQYVVPPAEVSNWVPPPSVLPSNISPWLMIPPASEGGNMVYKFYSIADDKVFGLKENPDYPVPDDDAVLVGSSHGWLALFNERNHDLFLWNPLTGRHVKLPLIETLDLGGGRGVVSQVLVSCSPELQDCRAMMTYGPEDRLAFCCPGRSTEWTQIGDLYHTLDDLHHILDDDEDDMDLARSYMSFVYSTKHKLFFCVTQFGHFEAWDLRNPDSPMLTPIDLSADEENYPIASRSEEELELKKLCRTVKFLVVNQKSGDVFLARRFILEQVDTNGSFVEVNYENSVTGYDLGYPYKTIGFDVHKYDEENRALRYMDGGSLDGLAFFIGLNHGFALSAGEFPELKPNSIYYTDVLSPPEWIDCIYGGHDLGIFSYQERTISPCFFPCDVKSITRIMSVPTWFTPSRE
ncbi:hypothetical protein ACP275_08G231000 [Erythranthe tilingii]